MKSMKRRRKKLNENKRKWGKRADKTYVGMKK